MTRANPCAGRYAGCTADPAGARMCVPCRAAHAAKEAARRAARKADGRCVVCARRAARVEGEPLTTCPTHREYYRARAAGA